ncbi:MAG: hypothetical protein K8S62_06070 [Candidatus Sabulitectum sp.]|nr:hypothetical protein [Candidatus Sabulitectum sp.]
MAILPVIVSGCATRSNTDFRLFHTQTVILAEETVATMESAQLLAEMNLVETIVDDNNGELLENLVLQREGAFTLTMDSTSISAVLEKSGRSVDEAALAINIYSLLLTEVTESQNIAFEINAAAGPHKGILSAAIAVLVEHGTIEHDAERTCQAMLTASPAIESISEAMAELTEATANSVQATYADMAARRQRKIVSNGYTCKVVMELVELNRHVTALLGDLQIIHDAWLTVPAIHDELKNSLTETSISATLRILAGRMNEIREESQRERYC